MNADTSGSEGKENKNLSIAEKARLAGAIWIHGSIDIEHSKRRGYYRPRIAITMPNPLPYKLKEDVGGKVYPGKKKSRNGREVERQFTLMIKRQTIVEKLLKEIRVMVGGVEEEQIDIALEIIEVNRSRKIDKADKDTRREKLFEKWKQKREELEEWARNFKAKYKNIEGKNIPVEIWSRAYLLEDC